MNYLETHVFQNIGSRYCNCWKYMESTKNSAKSKDVEKQNPLADKHVQKDSSVVIWISITISTLIFIGCLSLVIYVWKNGILNGWKINMEDISLIRFDKAYKLHY